MIAKELISIVLPTYNERKNVLLLINDIHRVLNCYSYEILVVDDNSADGTYQAVLDLADPRVTAMLRMEKPSLAGAIRTGLEAAGGDVLVVMDSDGNHQARYLPQMIDSLGPYDCVSGSRFLPGGGMRSRFRQWGSKVFNVFIRLTVGGTITDSLYGYFAIKRGALEQCDYDDIFWGYGDYAIRLFYYLQKEGARILEFPAVNGERKYGQGESRLFQVFWQYFGEVVKLMRKGKIKEARG